MARLRVAVAVVVCTASIVGASPRPAGAFGSITPRVLSLGTLGGTVTFPFGIDDQGDIVGISALAGDSSTHAFLWTQSGGMRDLTPQLANSVAFDVNNQRQVVGGAVVPGGVAQPFVWSLQGGLTLIQPLGTGDYGLAHAINELGTI